MCICIIYQSYKYIFFSYLHFPLFFLTDLKKGGSQFDCILFMFVTSELSTGLTDFDDSFFFRSWRFPCGLISMWPSSWSRFFYTLILNNNKNSSIDSNDIFNYKVIQFYHSITIYYFLNMINIMKYYYWNMLRIIIKHIKTQNNNL